MRVGGRVRPAAGVTIIYLYTIIKLAASEYGAGVPIEIKLWDTGRTPLAHMVDVTNGFGLKVLAEHNFLNDNNIAFSPYGLMGILVALFEGVDGESSYQIQMGMQLPWNRNVMRVGFRDIHRTLKTYFVPEEGFLAGLALNNENVTFNESYKKILRFYGFDLDNDQLPTLPPTNGTNVTTTAPPATGGSTDGATTVVMTTESLPAREETTPNPNAETITNIDVRIPTSTTTISPSSAPNAESTTTATDAPSTAEQESVQATTATETTIQPTTPEQTTSAATETTTTPPDTTTPTTVALAAITETETIAPSTSPTSTAALNEEPTVNNEVDVLTTPDTSNTASASTAAESTTGTTMTDNTQSTVMETSESTTSSMTETEQTSEITMSTTDMTTVPDVATTTVNESTLETLERKKKSIVDFIFTNPPYVDDYLVYRSYDIPIPLDPSGPKFDDTMFLANGLKSVQVAYMRYDTILEHAYLPHLEASALRLPLDSERYYLLVVLPSRGGASELGRLLSRMARESDLSDVYAALRPRRVRAIVPSFIVKGHVTLTTDLQKLGIRDVFEPRQRDFMPMTHQSGVYVRSIEQAVSVAIRKYRPDDNKKNRYVSNRQPVTFSATYPFLYFVMDASIHVALMAGKMVDPLNTRIL